MAFRTNYSQTGEAEKTNRDRRIYRIINHEIARVAKDPAPGFVKAYTESSTGEKNEYNAKFVEAITGYLTDVSYRTVEKVGRKSFSIWDVTLTADEGFEMVLPFSVGGRLASKFLYTLPNIDFDSMLTIKCWHNRREDDTALVFIQNEKVLRQYFTKENPNGLPRPIVRERGGKDEYDFRPVEDFLYDMVKNDIAPMIDTANKKRAANRIDESAVETEGEREVLPPPAPNVGNGDDIPF